MVGIVKITFVKRNVFEEIQIKYVSVFLCELFGQKYCLIELSRVQMHPVVVVCRWCEKNY